MLPCDCGQLRTPGMLSCFYYTTFLTAHRTYAQLVPMQCRVCAASHKKIVGIVISAHCDYKIYEMKTSMSSRVHEV